MTKVIVTFVIKVDPHLPVLNMKSSSPFGSPIDSDMRWKTERGTLISLEQYCICATLMNAENFERQSCISTIHSSTEQTHQKSTSGTFLAFRYQEIHIKLKFIYKLLPLQKLCFCHWVLVCPSAEWVKKMLTSFVTVLKGWNVWLGARQRLSA